MTEHHFLNLGAGVQSTALYLMSIDGDEPEVPRYEPQRVHLYCPRVFRGRAASGRRRGPGGQGGVMSDYYPEPEAVLALFVGCRATDPVSSRDAELLFHQLYGRQKGGAA
jgi:hypothetical protein